MYRTDVEVIPREVKRGLGNIFNFEDNERSLLLKDYAIIFKGIIKTMSYDPYDENDIIRGT